MADDDVKPLGSEAAVAAADDLPPLRTVNIQLVRTRNVGYAHAVIRTVQVQREPGGLLGIGLDAEDRIVEVTNEKQVNLKLGDQVRALDGRHLGTDNIVNGMKQLPRELTDFGVEVMRWPGKQRPAEWEITLVASVFARRRDNPAAVRRLVRFESKLQFSTVGTFNAARIVSLNADELHTLQIELVREAMMRPLVVGRALLRLEELGECTPPHVEWLPVHGQGAYGVVAELLVRVARCDWAQRVGTSPDTGVRSRAAATAANPFVEPLHAAAPVPRVADVPLVPPHLAAAVAASQGGRGPPVEAGTDQRVRAAHADSSYIYRDDDDGTARPSSSPRLLSSPEAGGRCQADQ